MKILLSREKFREQVLFPNWLFGRLLNFHNFNGFYSFILDLCRNILLHNDFLSPSEKKSVFIDNVLYTSIFRDHLLVVGVALCGCSWFDGPAHEHIDPLLLLLLSRERKKMSLLGQEVYVPSVLGVVPVVHVVLLISPLAMLMGLNSWFIDRVLFGSLGSWNCIVGRLIFNLDIVVGDLVAKVHFFLFIN